jgi:DNA-binding NtrC family response regulator
VEQSGQYQVFSSMPRGQNSPRPNGKADLKGIRLAPIVLLLSDDTALASLVSGIVGPPWTLVRYGTSQRERQEAFSRTNVRLVVFDDQAVAENDRDFLLAQIRKHHPGIALLYVAASQSDANEKRARANGAHYYVSRPLSLERFEQVLRSFLNAQQVHGRVSGAAGRPGHTA